MKQLLLDLADPSSEFDQLREQWEEDPYVVAADRGLEDYEVRLLIRGNLREIQKATDKQARDDGEEPTGTARAIIDN